MSRGRQNKSSHIDKISNEAYVVHKDGVGAVVSFSDREGGVSIGEVGDVHTSTGPVKIKKWGKNNDLPNEIDKILCDNNIAGALMTTKRDILIGNGIQPYIEVIEKGKRTRMPIERPQQVEEWMEKTDFRKKFLIPGANNLIKVQNNFTEIVFTKGGEVSSVVAHEAKLCRAGEKKSGKVKEYMLCGNWKKSTDKKYPTQAVRAYDGAPKGKAIYHNGDSFFNDGYYNIAAWTGGIEWLELANAIPKFHKNNLENGYSLRYHISIPKDYFLNKQAFEQAGGDQSKIKKCIDEADAAKRAFLDQCIEVLSGIANAGKTIHTTKEWDQFSSQWKEITITPIEADLKDEALLKLFDKSNQATISGQGIHPTLANIESQGKLSSGSEMRNAFNFYVAVKTRTDRNSLLDVWNIICKHNGWDKLKHEEKRIRWQFEDITLAKLDEEKTGVKTPTVTSES